MLFRSPRLQSAHAVPGSPVAYGVSRGLAEALPCPKEESELFPGFKQAQIEANLCVLGAPSAREKEWTLQSNKDTGGSINPALLVRSDFFPSQMFQDVWPS